MNRQVSALPGQTERSRKLDSWLFICVHTGMSKSGAYLFKMLAVGIQLERLVAYMNRLKI
jgi:hypothetical protein